MAIMKPWQDDQHEDEQIEHLVEEAKKLDFLKKSMVEEYEQVMSEIEENTLEIEQTKKKLEEYKEELSLSEVEREKIHKILQKAVKKYSKNFHMYVTILDSEENVVKASVKFSSDEPNTKSATISLDRIHRCIIDFDAEPHLSAQEKDDLKLSAATDEGLDSGIILEKLRSVCI